MSTDESPEVVVLKSTFRSNMGSQRVEFDAEGSWYCDDDAGIRIPYAEYQAITEPIKRRMLGLM